MGFFARHNVLSRFRPKAWARRALLAALLAALFLPACDSRDQRYTASIIGPFDTVTFLVGYARSQRAFDGYASVVFGQLEELHRLYDIFNAYEGLDNLYAVNAMAGVAPVKVERALLDMLLAAREAHEISGGMNNPAMGAVLRIWHDHRARGIESPQDATLPSIDALLAAAAHVSMSDLIIDEAAGTVFLRDPGMSLDVGSVGKGFAAGLAMEAAARAGMRSALLSVGGHVVALGPPRGRDHWNVAVENPLAGAEGQPDNLDIVALAGGTVSVSGAYIRFFEVAGQSFGHIIDPRTLMPAALYSQVVVVHPESWVADAVSTALFILPREEGLALARAAGAEALWIDFDGNWHYTPGYARLSSALP
ncbi:MAG: FAD:protein FMN transferase [Treponema sp.]|nr:FAD:protein FMN transferase [Treponema sp.]